VERLWAVVAVDRDEDARAMTRILVLPRYSNRGASSRLRTLQYLDELARRGIEFRIDSLFDDAYLDDLYAGRGVDWRRVLRAYAHRAGLRASVDSFDAIWLEKEAFPWLPAGAERWLFAAGTPLIVDYDDAIFHRYDQHPSRFVRRLFGDKIDVVMRNATVVIAGNDYLAERARSAGARRVEIVPTVVDLRRYPAEPRSAPRGNVPFTVGWIGTPQTAHFLVGIADALRRFSESGDVRYVFVGCPAGLNLGVEYEARNWSEATEVADLRSFDVGLMPLHDAPFERGKCGYKLIQYMACAVPVIASPVGVNRQIVTPAVTGYLATTQDEWVTALQTLRDDGVLAREIGARGRALVEATYSTQRVVSRLEAILRDP
jgi:glycosyltransferase involved in cell wall biosynthesis